MGFCFQHNGSSFVHSLPCILLRLGHKNERFNLCEYIFHMAQGFFQYSLFIIFFFHNVIAIHSYVCSYELFLAMSSMPCCAPSTMPCCTLGLMLYCALSGLSMTEWLLPCSWHWTTGLGFYLVLFHVYTWFTNWQLVTRFCPFESSTNHNNE